MKEKKHCHIRIITGFRVHDIERSRYHAWYRDRSISVRSAKAHLSALLELVASGTEVTITSDGKPKAKLVSVASAKICGNYSWAWEIT